MNTDLNQTETALLDRLLADRSMPYLELVALSGVEEEQVAAGVERLRRAGYVRVTGNGDIYDQIVTIRQKALSASA